MTKEHLAIRLVQVYPEISMDKAKKIMGHLISNILKTVKQNEPVKIGGFGTFVLIKTKSRQGVNPSTKEKITIPAYLAIKFRASETAKKYIRTPEI